MSENTDAFSHNCPKCGRDVTNEPMYVDQRIEDQAYQAVCKDCRSVNVQPFFMPEILSREKRRESGK